MIEFGKTLRTAREAKGLTPGQIAERTHMLVQTVEGLEREDFSNIVAPIYGRGFVKLYCEAVGLEPKPLVDAFMGAYSGGHGGEKKADATAEPKQTASVLGKPPSPQTPIAPERPPAVQETIDFTSTGAETEQRHESRYAAPMPIDDGFSMPLVNWRMVALGVAAVAIVLLTAIGVRAIYRITMTAPDEEQVCEASTAEPTSPAPTQGETATSKAVADRKPLPLKPFYIDSDHTTEKENK